MPTIIGNRIISNLKGNVSKILDNAVVTLTNSKGEEIVNTEKVLEYNEPYTIHAESTVPGYTIKTLLVNNIAIENGGTFTYKPGILPENSLDITIVALADDITNPVVTIEKINDTTFHWSATDNIGINGYAITNSPETPSDWITEGVLTEGDYVVENSNSYYVFARDTSNNIGSAFIIAFSIEYNLNNCELDITKNLTINDFFNSKLTTFENKYLKNISIEMDGVDITEDVVSFQPAPSDPSLFEFDGNTVIGYLGTDMDVVVPRTYSISGTREVIGASINYSMRSRWKSIGTYLTYATISNGSTTKTYTNGTDIYNNLSLDFPNQDAKLINFTLSSTSRFNYVAQCLTYPVYYENVKYTNYSTLYSKWRTDADIDASKLAVDIKGYRNNYVKGTDFNVTALNASAFQGNQSINKISILENISEIPSYAFQNCSSLRYLEFYGNISNIPSYMCDGCNKLESILITNSITSVGNSAFYNCTSLHHFDLPNTLISIGSKAFYNCGLYNIIIPKSVTSLINDSFGNCKEVISVSVEAENSIYDSRDNCNAIIYTATDTLFTGFNISTIPSTIKIIGQYAFNGNLALTEIHIPSSITTIDSYAFNGCTNLQNVTIDNGLNRINTYAFYRCSSLKHISLPQSLIHIDTYVFYSCSSLVSVTIPENVNRIGNYCFYQCTNLTQLFFNEPSTWYRTTSSSYWNSMTNGTSTSLTSPTNNATNFKSNYYNYYWYKK